MESSVEKTLVVIKPDALQRGIVGEIITRFEKVGLKIVAAKVFVPSEEVMNQHYPADRTDWVAGLGQRTLESYKEIGIDAKAQFGTEDPAKIGAEVRKWLVDFMRSGPVFAMVLEGPHAVEVVRKIVGATMPQKAMPGTIRGDFSFDSAYLGNVGARPIRNLIHASGNQEEAGFEVNLWFGKEEVHSYDTVHQHHMTK